MWNNDIFRHVRTPNTHLPCPLFTECQKDVLQPKKKKKKEYVQDSTNMRLTKRGIPYTKAVREKSLDGTVWQVSSAGTEWRL